MAKEKFVLTEFALSHDDIRFALYNLISDDDHCDRSIVDVYDNYFIYRDWLDKKCYKQSYTRNEDVVALDGEPVEVTAEWLTADEANALEELRKNYDAMADKVKDYDAMAEKVEKFDAMSEKLANYELEPSRMELFEKYSEVLSDNAEFNNLKNIDAHFTLSLEEIENKIDAIVLERAKTQMFEKKPEGGAKSPIMAHPIPTEKRTNGRYGDLFKKD